MNFIKPLQYFSKHGTLLLVDCSEQKVGVQKCFLAHTKSLTVLNNFFQRCANIKTCENKNS